VRTAIASSGEEGTIAPIISLAFLNGRAVRKVIKDCNIILPTQPHIGGIRFCQSPSPPFRGGEGGTREAGVGGEVGRCREPVGRPPLTLPSPPGRRGGGG